ncbi:MAG: hypothetical protein VCB59_02480, partial [Gammaproteobacteria bacterium]
NLLSVLPLFIRKATRARRKHANLLQLPLQKFAYANDGKTGLANNKMLATRTDAVNRVAKHVRR